ncbi:hypothetical protein EKO04_011012 [Ascochyta lentis]|uniref:Uncharacterized protein n=1 Tax=Ascochyta lentis TaxID=205686 RepID=A0A8H7MF89_9PLEO|nr:hypothetical protein EKO04_011012 [Ascochyta lentis]
MTSNGDLNASLDTHSSPRNLAGGPVQPAPTSAPTSISPKPKQSLPVAHNAEHDDNESEAETVVLSRNDDPSENKLIKTERDDDEPAPLDSIKENTHSRSPHNRRRRSSDGKHAKPNGHVKEASDEGKSPVPTSPSTASRQTKDTSPAASPANATLSPTQTITRGRSASTVENRKRKLRDEFKNLEPPRQKAKTEGLKDRTQPNSPATGAFGRPHKRSQSTQSMVSGAAGRKRREVPGLAVSTERYSDSSSDRSSSPRATDANPHTRVKRATHRALTSPARTMPHGRKTDRFGATRLARESEKGDLDAVKAAYDEAEGELDQADFAGITPLQKAALNGWAEVVEFLIDRGCRTDCESGDRDTPLIDAVENGHLEVVRLLLSKGHVNPHHQNKKGQRAIDVLDREDEDCEEIEKELKDAMRRQTDTSVAEPREKPGQKQAKSASRLLYNEYNVETLIEKAGDGDILAVGELINSNIKPNITCGVAAARGGHYDILSILLASGLKADPDPSKHPETPMTVAIGRGHIKIVSLLLEQDNFNPTRRNKEGKTYWEIAEERRGPKWEQERDMLKQASDEYSATHRSPRRTKKEPPNPSAARVKRKSSPRRERSHSPRPDAKRVHLKKSESSSAPQKARRLKSGTEVKRRKRVVDDDSSDDESEDEVRAPTRKAKQRSFSEGEEGKPAKKPLKARSDDNEIPKRTARARSNESDEENDAKSSPPKVHKKIEKIASARPTPEVESTDERKHLKNKIKYRTIDDKIKKRRLSDASTDGHIAKRTPTASAKSTPAPPERIATPEVLRERRAEEQRLEAEAKRKALEAEARKAEEEEAARRAAEEEEARKKAEVEARIKREAEEAEAARKQEEERARKQAEDEAKRQEELAARQVRIARLPRALRRACELGTDRPLHFSGEELGVSPIFLPLLYATAKDLRGSSAVSDKTYICSFQVVGILGLPELDLAHLSVPYSDWDRIPVTRKQRDAILRQYDVALLAQDFRFPMEGSPDFDYLKIQESIREAKNQFLAMDGLYWVEESLLISEVEKMESLQPLLGDIKSECKRRRIHVVDPDEHKLEKKHKPRKSFMDMVLAQNTTNGVTVNGKG